MGLYEDLLTWEEKLADLLDEGRQLSARVALLEQQNRLLQESHVQTSYSSGGSLALHGLYDEGYHICHAHFAQTREEDCLFCLSLLHQVTKEDGQEGL
ncbi:MAG: DNA replication initiation control protein YabA [Firmicutes bacterium]|nr:DNA replication initiation control protein YabA [Bacillota bacterium]